MSNGPLPSTLLFLSSLPGLPAGSKIRFLGCVTKYALSSGTLTLQHAYPPPPAVTATALVDVTLLLEGLRREDIQVGAWVNVIGYIEEAVLGKAKKMTKALMEGSAVKADNTPMMKVKAVMLWSAGGVKVGEYERVLEDRLRCEKTRTQ